ncbi:Colicin I receptor precursor [Sporomusa ovata DSM 2662]|uniref:TonB-dependent hemin receptor n=1 Tax=Sporomusa ovata TaxID=2378 RepID=A0A0U1L518_9FIRM|nr:TonB-dependent receptor [Sporomusa ovata]EQB28475.1 TonB-dependent receptor [Sporomusa ovata DSM 2662]CQR74797.1 TonB-dependent hemin receptor [Sporomusa ovata]
MNKSKLAVIASCLLVYSGFTPAASAEEATGDVEEVVVTADKIKELPPAKVTVINAEQIQAQGARNAAEALKDVPGVTVSSNSAQGKALAMFRGSDAENTRVFVDGIPLNSVVDGKVDLSTIAAENIEKIEVIKGAAPVMYGINAPGGVILITTKKTSGTGGSSVTVTTGSHRDQSLAASTSGKIGSLSYLLNIKRERTDGYTDHSQGDENHYNAKFDFDLNRFSSLTILTSYTAKHNQVPNRIDPETGEIITIQNSTGPTQSGLFRNAHDFEYSPWRSKYFAAIYDRKLSDNNNMSLKLYRTNEYSILKAYGTFGVKHDGDHYTCIHEKSDGWVNGLELQDTIKTGQNNTIIWGFNHESRSHSEWTDEVTTVTTDSNNKKTYTQTDATSTYRYTNRSLYLQDNLYLGPKLAVSFGIRHDQVNTNADTHPYGDSTMHHFSDKDSPTKPEASFSYAMTNRTTLHGSFSETYRWPNVTEALHPGGIYGAFGTQYWLEANPITGEAYPYYYPWDCILKQEWYQWPDGTWHQTTTSDHVLPEEAINREIGLTHVFPFGLKLDCTYFRKNITNMIKGQENLDQSGNQSDLLYYNIPYVQMHGFEIEGSYPINKRVKGFLSYSYTNAWDPAAWRQVSDIPYRKYSFGFIYTGKDGLNAYLSLNYLGSYYSVYSTGNGNGSGDFRTATTWTVPAHRTVDMKVSKEIANRVYYIKATNLLDKKFYQGAYLLAPGRYIEVGETLKF